VTVAGPGDNTVQLTRSAPYPIALTFSGLTSAAYPTVNFVIAGNPGTIGTDSKIAIAGRAAGLMNNGAAGLTSSTVATLLGMTAPATSGRLTTAGMPVRRRVPADRQFR